MKMFDANKIREDFPIFENNKDLIYFDNAATTQKPKQVLEALQNFYATENSNVHRAVYKIAEQATNDYENARKKVSDFLNAKKEELIWTRGATEAINHVLYGWAFWNLKEGDEIVTTVMEHHSNIVPWQLLLKRGVKLTYANIRQDGTLDMQDLENKISHKTKFVTATHVSNVLGTVNPAEEIVKIAHENGSLCLIDGAQSTPHMPIDFKKLGADFFVFSGHKMLGPTGIGGLVAKQEILENMEPALRGSEQIKSVSLYESKWADLPWKFEPGTPNIADAIAFGSAIDYLKRLGMENVHKNETGLTNYAIEKISSSLPELKIFGPAGMRAGVISFNFPNIHSHDVASILDENNIAIRSGNHCAMPLMQILGVPATCRASFYIYNTKEEVDKFVEALGKVKKVFE